MGFAVRWERRFKRAAGNRALRASYQLLWISCGIAFSVDFKAVDTMGGAIVVI